MLWRCRLSSTLWETSCLIWALGWFAWCATTQWLWLTSRRREARDRTLWCRWPYDCSSGATAKRLHWFPSICQECTTSRRIPCPESARVLLYTFPPFKMVPQVLQKIVQSPGVRVILIAQLQPAASWFPELMDLSQEDLILLFVEGEDLLWLKTFWQVSGWPRLVTSGCQIYMRGNSTGHTEGEGPFQGTCQYDVKVPTGIIALSVRIPLVKIRGIM